jgi:deazaflavin-dependent oxidoreductase (nitroreductase family)
MADQTPPRRDPGAIPTDLLAFNRALIEEFRANRGRLSGNMAGRSLLLLTTTGARSGRPRTAYRRDGDRYIAIASGNGALSYPAWYRNLQANPIATVEVGPEKFEVQASTAGPAEQDLLAMLIPYLESQQKSPRARFRSWCFAARKAAT